MMSPLHDLQVRLGRAILTGDTSRIAHLLAGDARDAEQRVRIHRNHYLAALTEALATTFPVVQRLLGAPCFEAIARKFAESHPPAGPCLFEYGGSFGGFLEVQPNLRTVPYVADVARLEWALNQANTAPDAPRLSSAGLRKVPLVHWQDLRLRLHSSCRLVASRFAVDDIWRAHLEIDDSKIRLELAGLGVRLLILRDRGGAVLWRRLSPGESRFLRGLRAGSSLGYATDAARQREPDFSLMLCLMSLIDVGVFEADLEA